MRRWFLISSLKPITENLTQMFPFFHTVRADFCPRAVRKPRPLEIGLAAAGTRRVKLRRADAVGIAAADLGTFIAERTEFSHNEK